jgi:hypothetical protein
VDEVARAVVGAGAVMVAGAVEVAAAVEVTGAGVAARPDGATGAALPPGRSADLLEFATVCLAALIAGW